MISEKTYYEYMCNFDSIHKFDIILERWYKCFDRILRRMDLGYKKPIIDSLFYKWEMENWGAMWQEHTEYKDYTPIQLLEEFASECRYICDRASYDRLFRTHWLFRKAFGQEFLCVCSDKEI
jgi:hypothetical protein